MKRGTSGEKKSRSHITRNYRNRYPLRYAYYTLLANAKRRGKFFDLTFEQFCRFAVKTEYMMKKGIWRESYHIDRIREDGGYTIDNIQLLTNSDNVKKYLKYYYDEQDRKMIFSTEVAKSCKHTGIDIPF